MICWIAPKKEKCPCEISHKGCTALMIASREQLKVAKVGMQ